MKIIACVGDGYGLMFNSRRVSTDRAVIRHILGMTEGSEIMCSEYSSELFPAQSVKVVNDIEKATAANGYYFLEDQDATAVISQAQELIVYYWNRKYPYDRKLPIEDFCRRLKKISQGEFKGNSHDIITWEGYRL